MAIFWTTPDRVISLRASGGAGGDQRHRQYRIAVSPLMIGWLRIPPAALAPGCGLSPDCWSSARWC
jgi:hypothetical protein